MIAFNFTKCMVIVMAVLLALGSDSTVEAVRRDEIKSLLDGAKMDSRMLREVSFGERCKDCIPASRDVGCKDCIPDMNFF
jgi:hypothetical protein